jgi:hypothetical protein
MGVNGIERVDRLAGLAIVKSGITIGRTDILKNHFQKNLIKDG